MSIPQYAISIRQPWAWLIVHGWKDIENRSRRSNFRGEALIHASKTVDAAAYAAVREISPEAYARLPGPHEIETGGIVGQANFIGCVNSSESKWFFGPHGLVMREQKPLQFMPCKGNQILFFRHGLITVLPALGREDLTEDAGL